MDNTATAQLLYELRTQHNYTQAELAKAIGISEEAVSSIEKGEIKPDIDVLYKLSSLYDVTVDCFLVDNQNTTESSSNYLKQYNYYTHKCENEDYLRLQKEEKIYQRGRTYVISIAVFFFTNILFNLIRNFNFFVLFATILHVLIVVFFIQGKNWARITLAITSTIGLFLNLFSLSSIYKGNSIYFIDSTMKNTIIIVSIFFFSSAIFVIYTLLRNKSLKKYFEYNNM